MRWPLVRLGSVTSKIGSGATPRGGQSVYVSSGTALIRSQNVLDNSLQMDGVARITEGAARQLAGVAVLPGDVLINITGDSIARVARASTSVGEARVNQHVAIIRTNPELESGFLQRALLNPPMKKHLIALSQGGATRKALTKQQIQELMIPLPDLVTQTAIADVLGALDDKIAANERANSLATALSNSFVLRASASVPLVPLGQLVDVPRRTVTPAPGGVWHFSLPAFDDGEVPKQEDGAEIKSAKQRLDRPSVLLSKLNPRIPRVWDVATIPEAHPALASTEFIVLEPRSASTAVLAAALRLPASLDGLQSLARGTSGSHQRVSPADAMALEIPDVTQLPVDLREKVSALAAATASRRTESARLAATRDALLPELMSGRLTVGAVCDRASM